MEITRISANDHGNSMIMNILSDDGRILATLLSRLAANILIGDARGMCRISREGSVTIYDFDFAKPSEPVIWYDEEPEEGPITYTAEDMEDAYEAGRIRSDYEADVFDVGRFTPDFAQFMDGLNTSKSMP